MRIVFVFLLFVSFFGYSQDVKVIEAAYKKHCSLDSNLAVVGCTFVQFKNKVPVREREIRFLEYRDSFDYLPPHGFTQDLEGMMAYFRLSSSWTKGVEVYVRLLPEKKPKGHFEWWYKNIYKKE